MQPGGELDQLRAIVRQFVEERDWDQFHTPKNLASALTVEAAEVRGDARKYHEYKR
jgi:NTP pyrophosphatase (non-canonical NTP hydrolase)